MLYDILKALLALFSIPPLVYYWRQFSSPLRHVNGPKNDSLWKGNIGKVYAPNGWAYHRFLVENFGGVVKIFGILGRHQLYVSDPTALHSILVQHADVYDEVKWYLEGNKLVFGPGLLSTTDLLHKRQRKMLVPSFAPKYIKELTPLFQSICGKLGDAIAYHVKSGPQELDMLNWTSRAALELIGQGGLGCSIDSLDAGKDSMTQYGKAIKDLVPTAFKLTLLRIFSHIIVQIGTPKFRRLILEILPSKLLMKMMTITDIMDKTSVEIYRKKKFAIEHGAEQLDEGRDILSILMKSNLAAAEQDRLPDDQVIAQMSTFIFAGHDTTSSALSRILHRLSLHPEAQHKLREEIMTASSQSETLSYDDLIKLPYLDAVIRETLRLHPPVTFLARTALQDMILPLSKPVKTIDGVTDISELIVPKGTDLLIAYGAANTLRDVWGEDAYEWKPERWLSSLPKSVIDARMPGIATPLLSFGAGPRSCIGFRYAELEMKTVLFALVKSFSFELPDGKEITWNLGGIQTPAIKGAESQTPTLPLKVSLITASA